MLSDRVSSFPLNSHFTTSGCVIYLLDGPRSRIGRSLCTETEELTEAYEDD